MPYDVYYFANGESFVAKDKEQLADGPFDVYHAPGSTSRPENAYHWTHRTWQRVAQLLAYGEAYELIERADDGSVIE